MLTAGLVRLITEQHQGVVKLWNVVQISFIQYNLVNCREVSYKAQ